VIPSNQLLREEVKEAAKKLGKKLRNEDGVEAAVEAFHKRLPIVDGEWREIIWENMKYNFASGTWSHPSKLRYTERSGTLEYTQEFVLPAGWEWTTDWTPEITSKTDPDGWFYSTHWGIHNKWKSTYVKPAPSKLLASVSRHSLQKISNLSGSHANNLVRTRKLIRTRSLIAERSIPPIVPSGYRTDGKKFTLFVEVIEAKGLKNTDTVGVSDPFCVLKIIHKGVKSQKQSTKVIDNNLNPVWKEVMWFEVVPEDKLFLHCWDKDPVGKDNLGKLEYPLKNIFNKDGSLVKDVWLPFTKNKPPGEVHLGFSFK